MSPRCHAPDDDSPPRPAGAPGIVEAARALLAAKPITGLDYFVTLQDGTMTRDAFVGTQQQFFHAVRFFSRPIAALVARCPDSTMRMDLVHNLAEEQGDFIPAQAHDRTFGTFLQRLGALPAAAEGPAVRAFNCTLLGVCLGSELEVGFGCLGFIEYAFADVAALIGEAVVARGWITRENLVHYKLHAEIDRRHAEEFFRVIEPAWQNESAKQCLIREGLALGHYAFARLYADLGGLYPPA